MTLTLQPIVKKACEVVCAKLKQWSSIAISYCLDSKVSTEMTVQCDIGVAINKHTEISN